MDLKIKGKQMMRRFAILLFIMIGMSMCVENTYSKSIEPRGYIGKCQLWETPYYIIEGAKKGPTIVVIGGTHGNELAGWQGAEQLLSASIDCGKLLIIPWVNIRAVQQNVREVPNEGNLNRAYPGNKDGNLTDKLALEILNLIRMYNPLVVFDLHESLDFYSEGNNYLGQTIITYVDENSINWANTTVEKMNLQILKGPEQFSVLLGPVLGSTAYAVGRYLGISSFTIETSKKLALEDRIRYQIFVIQTMLKELGVILTCNPLF